MTHHPKLEMSQRPDKGSNQHSWDQLEQKWARMTKPPAEGKWLGKERGGVGEARSLAVPQATPACQVNSILTHPPHQQDQPVSGVGTGRRREILLSPGGEAVTAALRSGLRGTQG